MLYIQYYTFNAALSLRLLYLCCILICCPSKWGQRICFWTVRSELLKREELQCHTSDHEPSNMLVQKTTTSFFTFIFNIVKQSAGVLIVLDKPRWPGYKIHGR